MSAGGGKAEGAGRHFASLPSARCVSEEGGWRTVRTGRSLGRGENQSVPGF